MVNCQVHPYFTQRAVKRSCGRRKLKIWDEQHSGRQDKVPAPHGNTKKKKKKWAEGHPGLEGLYLSAQSTIRISMKQWCLLHADPQKHSLASELTAAKSKAATRVLLTLGPFSANFSFHRASFFPAALDSQTPFSKEKRRQDSVCLVGEGGGDGGG